MNIPLKNLKMLIVEDNENLLEILTMLVHFQFNVTVDITSAHSSKTAIQILETQPIDYCICDHQFADSFGSEVLNYIIKNQLKTNFILCSSFTPEMLSSQYPKENVFFNIQKPEISEGLENLVNKIDRSNSLKNLPIINNDFLPLSINTIFLIGHMPSDVYIFNSFSVFEKIFNKGDKVSIEDKNEFEKQYTNKIFSKHHEHNDEIIIELNMAMNNILVNDSIPIDRKIAATHSQLKELISVLGISPTMAEMTKAIITEVVSKIVEEKNILLSLEQKNLDGNYSIRFYTLHSILLSVVAKKTSFNSYHDIYKLVFCAFIQDISLTSIPLMKLLDHNEFVINMKEFTSAEQFEYLNHPQKALESLALLKEEIYGVARIILEHHEMPNGKGFPNKLQEIDISPLGALFNLTGIFARFILKNENNINPLDFLDYMKENEFNHGRYKETFDVIKTLLLTQNEM